MASEQVFTSIAKANLDVCVIHYWPSVNYDPLFQFSAFGPDNKAQVLDWHSGSLSLFKLLGKPFVVVTSNILL